MSSIAPLNTLPSILWQKSVFPRNRRRLEPVLSLRKEGGYRPFTDYLDGSEIIPSIPVSSVSDLLLGLLLVQRRRAHRRPELLRRQMDDLLLIHLEPVRLVIRNEQPPIS